jgi:NADPH:quinone reductase-like Zn-dependent oxidoreductase
VLRLEDVEKPVPKDNEVLIKVHAATVTAGDCETRRFDMPVLFWLPIRLYMGLIKPRIKILGQELAGEIEATGKNVKQFVKGDQVFAATDASFGAHAEYKCLPEDGMLARKPANMTFAEAAVIPVGGINALHFLRKANIHQGQKLLIFGACGGIGTIAVQIAKSLGAEVTAVDSAPKLDVLRAIGADHVIDYAREDFTRNGETYDVIFDVVGKSRFSRTLGSLKPDGYYLLGNPGLPQLLRGLWASLTNSRTVVMSWAGYKTEDLVYLGKLTEAGTIKSVVDRSFALEQIIDAHRYVESGQKAGNVVIEVQSGSGSKLVAEEETG